MHQPEPTEVGTIVDPHILLRFPAAEDDGFDIKVTTTGLDASDELVIMLLLVVESITGVDSDLYTQQIDIVRRAAGLDPLIGNSSR